MTLIGNIMILLVLKFNISFLEIIKTKIQDILDIREINLKEIIHKKITFKVSGTCKYNSSKSAAKITGYVAVTDGIANEATFTRAISTVGPISVALYVTSNFQRYKSGVFFDNSCPIYGANHAVTLVGYGSLNGQDYYILKNSWGTNWGKSYQNIIRFFYLKIIYLPIKATMAICYLLVIKITAAILLANHYILQLQKKSIKIVAKLEIKPKIIKN